MISESYFGSWATDSSSNTALTHQKYGSLILQWLAETREKFTQISFIRGINIEIIVYTSVKYNSQNAWEKKSKKDKTGVIQ